MRNARSDDYDATPRAVVSVGNEYPPGGARGSHRHRRSQLLYGATGLMMVGTEQGRWIVPPQRAVWIPAGIYHDLHAVGHVSTRSLYIEPEAVPDAPATCQVLSVSALMRALLMEAVDLPLEYDEAARDGLLMTLLLREIERAPRLHLDISFPTSRRLAERCRAYLDHPSPHESIDDWCRDLAMSRRSFTRAFRTELGMSFTEWCRQACVVAALPRLAAGEPVTTIALELGYASPPAFTQMFRSVTGVAPSDYFDANGDSAHTAAP
jgi:AraC-like DNA-binding protein